jgi:hypothetical protein
MHEHAVADVLLLDRRGQNPCRGRMEENLITPPVECRHAKRVVVSMEDNEPQTMEYLHGRES